MVLKELSVLTCACCSELDLLKDVKLAETLRSLSVLDGKVNLVKCDILCCLNSIFFRNICNHHYPMLIAFV